jgi:hypothetical protein
MCKDCFEQLGVSNTLTVELNSTPPLVINSASRIRLRKIEDPFLRSYPTDFQKRPPRTNLTAVDWSEQFASLVIGRARPSGFILARCHGDAMGLTMASLIQRDFHRRQPSLSAPLAGNLAGLGSAVIPVFLAIAVWGVLGKLEKWLTPASWASCLASVP